MMETVHQRYQKVKAEAKSEMKQVRPWHNPDLDLSLFRSAILREGPPVVRDLQTIDFP